MKKKWPLVLTLLCAALLAAGVWRWQGEAPAQPQLPPGLELRGVKVTPCETEIGGETKFGVRFDTRFRLTDEFDYPLGTTVEFGIQFSQELFDFFGSDGTGRSVLTLSKDPNAKGPWVRTSTVEVYGRQPPKEGADALIFQPMVFTVNCYIDGELVYSQEMERNL